jgi:hypothetical protein
MNISADWTSAERLALILRIADTEYQAPGTRMRTQLRWLWVTRLASAPAKFLETYRTEIRAVACLPKEEK